MKYYLFGLIKLDLYQKLEIYLVYNLILFFDIVIFYVSEGLKNLML